MRPAHIAGPGRRRLGPRIRARRLRRACFARPALRRQACFREASYRKACSGGARFTEAGGLRQPGL